MKRCGAAAVLFLLAFSAPAAQAPPPAVLDVGAFSREIEGGSLPAGWKTLSFRKVDRPTHYTLERDGETVVVKAEAKASASSLYREMRIDPAEYPVVQWRWKVSNILQKGDIHRKDGDDYPARLYITFDLPLSRLPFFERAKAAAARILYGQTPPLAVITYLWESRAPRGTTLPSPYADRVRMIVVESGEEKVGQWGEEERNVADDYRRAFGEDPPMISGVAVMTDTDNTGESVTAWYGDILFRRAAGR
jgi:hypothetical protein